MEDIVNQYNYKSALQKMMKICSTQEKCKHDIYTKLLNWKVAEDIIEKIIEKLVSENFIDESRYSKAFVNDKFKFNKWGKTKIRFELRNKHISEADIENGLEIISEDEYFKTATELLKAKLKSIKNNTTYEIKSKLIRYGYSRGFEQDLLYKIADSILK
ncbi:MAG TPA: RecX family transcriptional regulator [Bacteroidales bacterium]|nr:MAG: hypothetical protein A2W98_11020 [Bacteroidetes bacterium GWF2_33_38]OFY91490.1 MAG: hypothetical protein A2236_05090 [Bacteroidetes bacterium RIFOXYA2_FULL_33_7]HBF88014.1 RecX family transcriptional regulator [Bacteroidales bacterium]